MSSTLKMLSEDKDLEHSDIKKRSLSTESLPLAVASQIRVFLRIRPTSTPVENENHNNVYTVEDSSTLFVKQVNASDTARRLKLTKSSENVTRKKFMFSKIFDVNINQAQFFTKTIEPIVIEFLNNQSSSVLTYGTTDAGKSYTLFGSLSEPGVIPRCIVFIFSSLDCTLVPLYKPERFSSVVGMNECQRLLEDDAKEKFLSTRLADKSMYEEAYESLKNLQINKKIEVSKNFIYSVWISFIEIYNEAIFDLLEMDVDGKNTRLKLAIDKHGITYIQGMRSICVTSGLEAFEILNAGQMRLSTVITPNYKSSRSHSIFTIKMLKYEKHSTPSEVEVSSISFCDMAGTGKIQKLVSDVKELKESRSINTSLLALGRCVKLIAKGHTRQSIGSFRDSKLTRLFQHSLSGHENILLLISVNPSLELFVETQNVLNFASTAMKLTSEFTKEDKKVLDYRTPISSSKAHEIHSPTLRKVFSEQEIADIKLTNKQLSAEIKELKSKNLKDEYEIRQELADFYLKQFSSLEENWKSRMLAVEEEKTNLLRISIREVENNYKEKLEKLTDRKRKRIDRGDFEECTDAEVLDDTRNVHYSSIMLPLTQNSEQSVKRDSKILNQKKNRYSSELLLLRKSLKTLVESIKNPDKQSVNVTYFKGLSTKIFDTKNPFDKEAISDLTTIAEFIMKPYELANKRENLKQVEPASSTKGIQCNMECTMLSQFCKEIRELLDPNFVKLPDIDNDLNLSEYAQDEDNYDQLITLLHQVKELIMEKVSKIIEFEVENIEKSDQFKALKAKIEEQERDILQSRIQQQESESSRLALLERIEDFESKAKSKEFFKDFDFETENLKATSIDETHYELNITDKLSIPETSYDNNCSLCLCESDSDKNDSGAGRLTSDSSKNDSGLASSVEYPIGNAKDEMYQTNVFNEENKVILNIDYECRKTQPLEDSLRLTELSQELEEMKAEMTRLKENYFAKELIIHEYQRKFSADKIEIERLNSEKQQLEIKCDESMKNERDNSKEYEAKLAELQVKLKVHEDGENGEARCLEHYWGESVNLGSQLSSIYSQLEKSSTACKEYMIKINQLEKEFNVTRINENKVLELLIEYKSDHAIMSKLSEKVNDFENTLTRMEKEKADLQELLCEKSKSASEVEEQSTDIIKKFEECDKQVLSLKSEISVITRTNLTNRRKATELGDEVAKLMQKISKMEENLKNAEAIRKDLEQSSNKEIGNLRSRLIIFEENAKLLNIIRDGNENKPSYVDKLQRKLLEKEKELEFFRKNRSATIQRYECLVGHLQDALKMNDNLNKTKGTFPPKQNYFFSDYEESLSWDIHDSTSQARRPTSLYDTDRLSSSNVQDIMYFTYAENAETTISKEDADHLV